MQRIEVRPSYHYENNKETKQKEVTSVKAAGNNISRIIQFCTKLGQCPIHWDVRSHSACTNKSRVSDLLQGFYTALAVFHCSFCLFRLAFISLDQNSSTSERIYMQTVTLFSIIPLLCNIIFILNSDDIVSCINIGVPFFKNYEKFSEANKKSWSSRKLPIILQCIRYSFNVNSALYLLLFFVRPDSPEFITSILPSKELRNSLMLHLAVLPFYAIFLNSARTAVIQMSFFTFCIAIWAKETLKDLSVRVTDRKRHRELEEYLKQYSQMRIIMKIFDRAISILIPGSKLITIIPATFSLYALVKLEVLVSILCFLYALETTFLLELVLSIMAQPFVHSSSFLQKVKLTKASRASIMRRRLKAMKPIAVTVGGGMYFVDRMLMLTVLEIIVTNAVNVLLMSEK